MTRKTGIYKCAHMYTYIYMGILYIHIWICKVSGSIGNKQIMWQMSLEMGMGEYVGDVCRFKEHTVGPHYQETLSFNPI